MKISDCLVKARAILDQSGVSNSKLDSLVLLSYALFISGEKDFSKERIIFNPSFELSAAQSDGFFELIKRRANFEPVSHLIGKREFFGADFLVTSDVLDPRPDSETLIESVLKNIPDKNSELQILELGVGSGCLIITLLKHYQKACGTGVDLSRKALAICQKNLENHLKDKRLQLFESDLFGALSCDLKFDLIVSNPPYIASSEIEFLQEEVKKYEPKMALDGGLDGLDFYRKIAQNAQNFLKKDGKVVLEIGFGQENDVIKIFQKNGFEHLESKADLSGIVRVLWFFNK